MRDCCTLSTLPESIGNLKNLKVIKLDDCIALNQLPPTIGNLKSLERLIIVHCALTELPESVGGLYALKELQIKDCSAFTIIPESFGDLICRKAHGEEGSALETVHFISCPGLVLCSQIKQALEIWASRGLDFVF